MTAPPDKVCATCGRAFAWRRRWARCWDTVRHCGERCRRNRPTALDVALEQAIVALLERRAAGATICPSEAARAVHPDGWSTWMERTRMAARRLAARGVLDIVQRGRAVDPSSARGPIRLRRRDPRACAP